MEIPYHISLIRQWKTCRKFRRDSEQVTGRFKKEQPKQSVTDEDDDDDDNDNDDEDDEDK
ncbi:MAG: hypothetical protein M1821_000742 [Bathelium mastoideum]|nr:MAG: hypothetical protein M1821_000742 [Bathelium mastoideum]